MQDSENFIKYYSKSIDDRKTRANCIVNNNKLSSSSSSSSSLSSASQLSMNQQQQQQHIHQIPAKQLQNLKKINKQDRLKKICTLALELQTQLQQTRFKFLDGSTTATTSRDNDDVDAYARRVPPSSASSIESFKKAHVSRSSNDQDLENANEILRKRVQRAANPSPCEYMQIHPHQQLDPYMSKFKEDDLKFKNITKRPLTASNQINYQHPTDLDRPSREIDTEYKKRFKDKSIGISNFTFEPACNKTDDRSNKQDRLKKICTMALELQTQMQQKKFNHDDGHLHSNKVNLLRPSLTIDSMKKQTTNPIGEPGDAGYYLRKKHQKMQISSIDNCLQPQVDANKVKYVPLSEIQDLKYKNITKRPALAAYNSHHHHHHYHSHHHHANTENHIDYEVSNNNSQLNEDDDTEDLERSYRQLLPSESHIKSSIKESKELHERINCSTSLDQGNNSNGNSKRDNRSSMDVSRLSFDENSFKRFTDEIVKRYMHEEEMRSQHQAHLLQLKEKALIEKTNSELIWLKQMKKRIQSKGDDEKMPLILKKQQEITQRFKREQDNIRHIKQLQRKTTEDRLKLLSNHQKVMKWCKTKFEENNSTSQGEQSIKHANNVLTTQVQSTRRRPLDPDCDKQDSSLNEFNGIVKEKLLKKIKQQLSSDKYFTQREKILSLKRKSTDETVNKHKTQAHDADKEQRKQLSKKVLECDYFRRIESKLKSNEASQCESTAIERQSSITAPKEPINEDASPKRDGTNLSHLVVEHVDDSQKPTKPVEKHNADALNEENPNKLKQNTLVNQSLDHATSAVVLKSDQVVQDDRDSLIETVNISTLTDQVALETTVKDRLPETNTSSQLQSVHEQVDSIGDILNKLYSADYDDDTTTIGLKTVYLNHMCKKIQEKCEVLCEQLFKWQKSERFVRIGDIFVLNNVKIVFGETSATLNASPFDRLIFDLIIELINDLCTTKASRSTFMPSQRTIVDDCIDVVNYLTERIFDMLRLSTSPIGAIWPTQNPTDVHRSRTKWKKTKQYDLVDNIIENEMYQNEQNWCVYDKEEHDAKLLLSDAILDYLIMDTIDLFCFLSNS